MQRHIPIFKHPLLSEFQKLNERDDISTFSTIETREDRVRVIIHNIDSETLELAKIIKDLQYNHEWESYEKHLDKIDEFEKRLADIKENLLLHYDIETWPIYNINENSLSFTRTKISYL